MTGSQHYLMMESVSQSLAGRIGILYLLPLAFEEVKNILPATKNWFEYAYNGTYPQLFDGVTQRKVWYSSYVQTYLERDVRQLKQVNDLPQFQLFKKLCAGRAGHILNYSELAKDAGITRNTSRAWISVLEANFIVFFTETPLSKFQQTTG